MPWPHKKIFLDNGHEAWYLDNRQVATIRGHTTTHHIIEEVHIMKKVKQVNGYTIYQAVSTRDADNHNCHVGSYNIYLSSDIRDFGLTNSYPEWEDEDSLAVAIARCKGSNYAVAVALADELSDSTIQDMDLCLEIERRLDAGDSINGIIDCYDRETGRLYATVSEAIAAGYEPFMDDYAAGLVEDFEDDVAELDDSPAGEPQPEEGKWYVDDDRLDDTLREELAEGVGEYDTIDTIEEVGIWGVAVLEIGYADIEVNVTRAEGDAISGDYFVCLKQEDGEWFSHGYIDREVTIDWSAPDWKDRLHEEMRAELIRYADEQHWDLSTPFVDESYAAWAGLYAAEQCPVEPEPQPEQQRCSHASYYVVESDGAYYTKTIDRTDDLLGFETYKRAFFRKVAERVAMSDCGDDTIEEIVFNGEPCHYTGWQPGMVIEFASDITGEIVYSGSFPEWDH